MTNKFSAELLYTLAHSSGGTPLRVKVQLYSRAGGLDEIISREDLGRETGRLLARVSRNVDAHAAPRLVHLDYRRLLIVVEASPSIITALAKQPEVAGISLDRQYDLDGPA